MIHNIYTAACEISEDLYDDTWVIDAIDLTTCPGCLRREARILLGVDFSDRNDPFEGHPADQHRRPLKFSHLGLPVIE